MARALAPLIAASLVGTLGCSALAGVSDLEDWPCDEPCGDSSDDASSDALDSSTIDRDTAVGASDGGGDVPLDTTAPAIDTAPTIDAARTACKGTAASMVDVGGYAIDRTEVTNAQYAAFLATSPSTGAQDAGCTWNTSFEPAAPWPAPTSSCDHPVANVDWCDAAAYCAFAGKRLCGNPTSGGVPFSSNFYVTAARDAWYGACSSGGVNTYPYPGGYVAKACVDASFDPTASRRVASLTTCQPTTSPYLGVFDLVGNVAEWQDSCEKTEGKDDKCRARGGAFDDDGGHASCLAKRDVPRSTVNPTIGFRCCSK